jgi:hypothetical protein
MPRISDGAIHKNTLPIWRPKSYFNDADKLNLRMNTKPSQNHEATVFFSLINCIHRIGKNNLQNSFSLYPMGYTWGIFALMLVRSHTYRPNLLP